MVLSLFLGEGAFVYWTEARPLLVGPLYFAQGAWSCWQLQGPSLLTCPHGFLPRHSQALPTAQSIFFFFFFLNFFFPGLCPQRLAMQTCMSPGMNGEMGLPCWKAENGCRYSFVILEPCAPYQMVRMRLSASVLRLPQHPRGARQGTVAITDCQRYRRG